jgi:hypothetical protein
MNMKKTLWISVLLAFSFIGMNANAQNTLGSTSSTNTNTVAQSGLQNEQNFITNNPGTVDYKGGFKTVPSAVVGAFSNSFSSDYCDGTAQVGASWLGGAFSGGKPILDEGCQLLRSSDMLMRISVQIHAEASEEYNLASKLQGQIVTNTQAMKATPMPFENKTVLTFSSQPETDSDKVQGKQIQAMKDDSYQKSLKADMLETAAIYNVCAVGTKEKDNLEAAGFKCPSKK